MSLFLTGMMLADQTRSSLDNIEKSKSLEQSANLVKTDVADLRGQVERLCLLNQALWELIQQKLHITDEDLANKAQEVDLRDGKQDGRMSSHPLRCPNCGRVSNSRHKKCLYCNLEFEGSVFD